jgi:hypothetical protein
MSAPHTLNAMHDAPAVILIETTLTQLGETTCTGQTSQHTNKQSRADISTPAHSRQG